jgi:hypothetical protein
VYFEFVRIVVVVQHTKSMRRAIVVCGLSDCTLSSRFWEEKDIECKMCVLILFTTFFSETFLILIRIQRGITINIFTCSCQSLMKLEFCQLIFEKSPQVSNFMKTPSSGSRVVT